MAPHTKPTLRRRGRKLRPDALSPEKPRRTAANALGDWREIDRRAFWANPGAIPPARSVEVASRALRSGSYFLFPSASKRKFSRLYEFLGRRRVQPPAFGYHGHDTSARRVFDVLHAISGGNHTGYVAGDFRVP